MPGPTTQPETPWSAESVRRWFAAREGSVADERSTVGPHQRAAAVLASFDHRTLRTPDAGPLDPARLSSFLADCAPTPNAEGAVRWSLKPEARRKALASFPDAATLRAALSWNPRPTGDLFQQTLDAYILGNALAPEAQTDEQLGWSTQVVAWLNTTPFVADLKLPNPDDVRRRLDFVRLLAPLRRMVGAHFEGRAAELGQLRDFLFGEKDADFAPKPLMVHGFGGSGKTTLVAKFLLDYSEGRLDGQRGPFVFLDFDRPALVPEEPATLLLEAARQVAAQSRDVRGQAESLALSLESMIRSWSGAGGPGEGGLPLGQILTGITSAFYFNQFADLFRVGEWAGRPLLFVLDTFEEVQYHSRKVVEHVWSFLGELRERLPGARIVVSGRAPLQMETRTSPVSADMPLDELDEDAAIACLAHDDVPAEVARFIHGHVGGNPLALRLAGDLARAESESAGGFREFISTEFASKLDDEVAQAILFRRFLGHIKSPDVRKLAHPGLTLRKITPELIKDVLAVPCGIDVPTLERANELWNELARETAVVIQDSAATLRHRPELRRQMIGLLRNSKPEQVRAIREAAIAYYQGNDHEGNTESRAERFYHMLCLDRPRTELDAAWEPGLEPYILSAREELSEEALIYLASRSEFVGFEAINTSESEWREQALVIWERKTAQWARELIRQDRHEDVDKALRLRTDRSPDSPLHLIHARVLKSLGRHEESLRALESALRDWPDEAGRTERIDLLLLQVRVLLNLDRRPEAAERLAETAPLVERSGTAEQHLEAASLAVRVASSSGEIVNAVARLAAVAGSWRDSQFRRVPELARKAAALMLRLSPSQAARIVRSVGLGPIDPEDQERLASAFTRWERASWQRSARKHMKPHGIAFLAGAEGDGRASGQSEGFWRRWFASTPPEELGGRLASMIELFPPNDRAREALRQTLLGRDDVAERRTGKARASEQGLSSADILSQAARLLAGAYDSKELERMLAFHLDIRLHDIVSPSLSFNQMIFEVLLWAERRGRLLDLMRAAAKVRPDRADLAEFVRVMEASLKA